MTARRWFLLVLLLSAAPAAAQPAGDAFWLIGQISGRWEYRDGPDGRERQLTGKYDSLPQSGEVRCLETDLRKCELRYLASPRSQATSRLAVPLKQTGQWVRLKALPPPPPAVLPVTAAALAQKFTTHTRPGGSRAASGCGGNFPLWAPACGENLDLSDFKLRWQPPAEGSTGNLLVIIQRTDGSSAPTRDSAPAVTGEFSSLKLTDFLRKLQSQNATVDVTVTVKADDQRSAVRVVRIPPLTRAKAFEQRLKQLTAPDPVVRAIAVISLSLDEEMYSRAADEASRLLDLVSDSPPLLEYAMAGLCQSGFEGAKGEARKYGPEDLYNRICLAPSAKAPKATEPGPPAAGAQPAPADPNAAPRSRTGLALLIGNSDYWDTPLNSVKNDLQGMKETLENLGFTAVVRENLKRPQDFTDAVARILKDEQATGDDILLVYYSGHGVQIDGRSYLLGTGVPRTARTADDAKGDAQSAEALLLAMEQAVPGTRIFIVEACRDNLLSAPAGAGAPVPKSGFAFSEEIPNTFVMFANKPGLQTPVRSEYGLMGPFTEALIYALNNSSGEIQDVYRVAAEKTRELSPGQEPDEHHSRTVDQVLLRPRDLAVQDKRAKDLLNGAEPLYVHRAWNEFLATVERGRVLASDPDLQRRFSREVEFAKLAREAEAAEDGRKWAEAAEGWQKAGELFPARQWATMKAAVEWLLAGNVANGTRTLAVLAAQSGSETSGRARQMLAELLKAFPAFEAEAGKAAQATGKVPAGEFETIKHEE